MERVGPTDCDLGPYQSMRSSAEATAMAPIPSSTRTATRYEAEPPTVDVQPVPATLASAYPLAFWDVASGAATYLRGATAGVVGGHAHGRSVERDAANKWCKAHPAALTAAWSSEGLTGPCPSMLNPPELV